MLRIVLLIASTFTLIANAASLQNPIVTTAYYTSVYPGIYELNAINNNGIAVGEQPSFFKNGESFGVAYDSTSRTVRGIAFLNSPYDGTRLTGINDSGTYVGYGTLQSPNPVSGGFIGSLINPLFPLNFAPLNFPGARSTFPYAINNSGTIVGGYTSSTDGLEHGFIYRTNGTFQTLDDPAFQNTALVGINNHGQIVGNGSSGGFLYSGGSFVQLAYGTPTSINDSGAIAINSRVYGGGGIRYPDGTLAIANVYNPQFNDGGIGNYITALNNQGTIIFPSAAAFVATPDYPVPEPAAVGLLVIGALGLIILQRFWTVSA